MKGGEKMYIAPNSIVKVLKGVPLDASHKNVIKFNTVSDQLTYFNTKVVQTFSNCYYIKEQRKLKVGVKADNLYACNYLMFQNPSYGSKWFFAFITNVEYVNNDTTELTILLDDFQTWLLGVDYELKPSFVEREHVTDDAVGAHIIDEGLALNDFVTNAVNEHIFTDWWICVGSTVELPRVLDDYAPAGGWMYGKIYSGVSWYCFNTDTAVWALPAIMKDLASKQKSDAIVSMFMIPKDIVSTAQNDGGHLQDEIRTPVGITVPRVTTLDGYTPRNKKLLTYPYRSLVMSNNEGNAVTLRYEFFNGGEEYADIEFVGGIQPNSKIIAYPISYKGITRNLQESVAIGNFPQCCWQQEVYAQWLAQQQIRWGYTEERFYRNAIPKFIGSAVSKGLSGATTAGGAGAVIGAGSAGIDTLNNQLDMYSKMAEEKEVYSHVPNSVKGTIGNGYTNISINKYGFQLECKTIKSEVAQSIDGYFDMYGYKVNALKVPNINTRPHWNYVKTIGATVIGDIPADSLVKIASIYDNGVTFWKYASEVGNYNLNNSIA
jgi:hypothetical protein